ncbi:hypothetical protein Tco_1335328 [Tanacetum coccineum]
MFFRIVMIGTAEGVGDLNSSRLSVLKCLLDDQNSRSGSLKERAASVETNARQCKGKLHGIISTTSFTPQGSFKQRLKRNLHRGRFKRAFVALFDQDVQTFTGSMLLNLNQLEQQLDKEEFQEIGSMDAFSILKTQSPIDERAQHKREYDNRVNERQMQSKEGKVDSSTTLDASLVVTECSGTKSDKQDTSSSSGNYITHAVDADIRPVNDQVPLTKINKEIEILETINIELEHSVAKLLAENEKLHKENEHLKQTYKDLYDSIKKIRVQTKDHNDPLIAQINSKTVENAIFKGSYSRKEYSRIEVRQFRDTLIQHMESVKKSIDERAQNKREHDSKVNERKMQSKKGKVDSEKILDDVLVVTKSSGTESEKHVSSSRSGKDTHAKDVDVNSMNDKQLMAEVQLFAEHNILANEQQHSEQFESVYDTYLLEKIDRNTIPKSTDMSHRGGEIDQNADAKKCQVSCPLLDPSFDNITTKYSNQSLKSENISLKKTVAQLQKDFSRMETHCVIMELKYQNQVLNNGQHGQILNETSNKAKIKKEIKVLETINIELEHNVTKLLAENKKLHKENEHLKQTYKDLYDSIKKTRVQTKDHNDSLIAQINSKTVENADLKAQIQEKVFANAALKTN